MCAVSHMVHTSNIASCQKIKKKPFSFPVAVNNSIKVGPLVFPVINVCNHGEHYETPSLLHIITLQYVCLSCDRHMDFV